MKEILGQLLELKQYINPEFILKTAGHLAIPVLVAIIFAETGLMIGFFLPGDSLLFLAGLFSATELIPGGYWALALPLALAAVVGDQVGYFIGRKIGPALFTRPESRFFKPKYVHQTKAFYDRHGGKTIIIGRFVPFVRTFAPMVAGVVNLDYKRFVSYNIFGGILWIFSMTALGYVPAKYFLSEAQVAKYLKPNLGFVSLAIIFISLIPVMTTAWKERQLARQAKQDSKSEA